MIACVYRMSRTNVGDKVCCPADYVDLGEVARVDIVDYERPHNMELLRCASWIVLGGGGLFYFDEAVARILNAFGSKTIVWGVGANRHGSERVDYPPNLSRAVLVGLRDDCDVWVPCASCLSHLFDPPRQSSERVVIYEHKNFPIIWDGACPRLRNDVTFEAAVEFLAQGQIVVTNSYHGAYWAQLLGRTPVLYQPFSSKFHQMKWQPLIAHSPDDLLDIIAASQRVTPIARVAEARQRTAEFSAAVAQLTKKSPAEVTRRLGKADSAFGCNGTAPLPSATE